MKALKVLLAIAFMMFALSLHGQTAATVTNFTLRAADTAQTCYNLATSPTWREYVLPVKSCAGVAAWNGGTAALAWTGDRWLRKHGHPHLAQLQWFSAAGSGQGIIYTLTWHK